MTRRQAPDKLGAGDAAPGGRQADNQPADGRRQNGALVLDAVRVRLRNAATSLFAPLSLTVTAGDVLTVMGASGIGKSTLIDWIGGHLDAAFEGEGRVILDGRDITRLPPEKRRIGVLFQDPALFAHLSVGDNLAFGLRAGLRGRAARRAAVSRALAEVGLAGFERRDPATLSGGQRARVALMRAMLADPHALLLDEPFARLDAVTRDEVRSLIFERVRAQGIPVLLVTHDAGDAAAAKGPVVTL